MAVTIHVKQASADAQELSLTLDAPRLVIGRSQSCELRLMDPSVSARHCSLRHEGGRNVIVDEGSINGVMVDGERLPPQTPHPVRDGDVIRVGRVWLELRFATSIGSSVGSSARRTAAFAIDVLAQQLRAQGERVSANITVVAGPDAGKRLELDEADHEYVIGRSRDADLVLSDELVSRHHAAVARNGGSWHVSDRGSKRGTVLTNGELTSGGAPWGHSREVMVGDSVLRLIDPVAETFAELAASDDVRMRSKERDEKPPGYVAPEAEVPVQQPAEAPPGEAASTAAEDGASAPEAETDEERQLTLEQLNDFSDAIDELVQPMGRGYAVADVFVALMALSLLSVSAAGLWWVLA
jgi:pSer/pThr/pTyr-binding forkhead associated (FHA) protein